MITGNGRDGNGRPVLVIGLSGENMTRLMADEPIIIDGAAVGFGDLTVALLGGRTEQDIVARLSAVGLVNAGTEVRDHRPGTGP